MVYMVAGMSKRFGGVVKGLVDSGPLGKLIDYSLNQSVGAGFTKIVLIVSDKTYKPFHEHLGDSWHGRPIVYSFQKYDSSVREKPWGTADALCSALPFLNCPFVVCNGDDLYGSESFRVLAQHLLSSQDAAAIGYTLGKHIPENGAVNRGIFSLDDNGNVSDIKEVIGITRKGLSQMGLTGSEPCSMNIFGLHGSNLALLANRVREFKSSHSGDAVSECYLPIELAFLVSRGKMAMKLYPSSYVCLGITNPGDEVALREKLAAERAEFAG